MSDLPDGLESLLDYLRDIGYGDLYLPAGAAPHRPAGAASSGAAGDPAAAPPARPSPSPRSPQPPPAARRAGERKPDDPEPAAGAPTLNPHDTLFGVPPSGWERFTSLRELETFAADCTRCRLSQGRTQVVFGTGAPDAGLMFIGEGPGAEEDRRGEPFVGPAGKLLDKIIEAIDLTRDRVYIANIVKCRPPGNRDPVEDEVAACRGYLERQIDLVRPRVIVALGRVAAQTLLESQLPLGRLRGRWHSVRGVPVRVTYHPAALLRNASWKRPTWEDMKVVRERLRDTA